MEEGLNYLGYNLKPSNYKIMDWLWMVDKYKRKLKNWYRLLLEGADPTKDLLGISDWTTFDMSHAMMLIVNIDVQKSLLVKGTQFLTQIEPVEPNRNRKVGTSLV